MLEEVCGSVLYHANQMGVVAPSGIAAVLDAVKLERVGVVILKGKTVDVVAIGVGKVL